MSQIPRNSKSSKSIPQFSKIFPKAWCPLPCKIFPSTPVASYNDLPYPATIAEAVIPR